MVDNKPTSVGWEPPRSTLNGARDPQKQDEPRTIEFGDTSKPQTAPQFRETREGFQRDPPPHVLNPDQDGRRGQYTRREDGLRIDRNRTSKVEGSDGFPRPVDSGVEVVDGTSEQYDIGGVDSASEPIVGRNAVDTGAPRASYGVGEAPDSRSAMLSPTVEGSKPAGVRQSTLLERIAPVSRSVNENDEERLGADGGDGVGVGADRARKQRGRRPSRGGRR